MPYWVNAQYPTALVTGFSTHVNQSEIVDAAHPNTIQAEVYQIEATIGVNPQNSGTYKTNLTLNASGSLTPNLSTYFYTGYTTFSTLGDRITNLENLAATAYSTASALSSISSTVTTTQQSLSNIYAVNAMGGF